MTERGPVAFYLASLVRNLVAGARLALFLRVRAYDYRAAPLDFVLLALFSFGLWVAAAAARMRFEGEFDLLAIPAYMSGIVLVLAAALLVGLAYRAPGRLLLVAVALTASQPLFHVIAFLLLVIGIPAGLVKPVYLGFLAWIWIASARAVAVCVGTRRPQFLQALLGVTAMLAIDFAVLPEVEPWKSAHAETATRAPPLADERLFHAQGQLIERALAAVQAGGGGAPPPFFFWLP